MSTLLLWDMAPRDREGVLRDTITIGLTIVAVTTIITTATVIAIIIITIIAIIKGRTAPKCQCGPLTPDSEPPQETSTRGHACSV